MRLDKQGVAAQQGDEARPRRIRRFLEPCLLLILQRDEFHGYELLTCLEPFGFAQGAGDLSTVYRLLRGLEDRGLVVSRWDTSNPGPARRLYRLTEAGSGRLARWVRELRATDRVLHSFLDAYESYVEAQREVQHS